MKIIARIKEFVERELWQIDLSKVRGPRQFIIRLIRTVVIAIRDFRNDNYQLRASALTFYTLLSIVPVVAMLFGIAKGFGLEKRFESEIKSDIGYNQEIIEYLFSFANRMLENTKGGVIAGLGVILLFWAVMKLIGNIESSFNDIWEVSTARSWIRKFSDYLAIILVAPIVIILSGSATVFISTQVTSAANSIELFGYFGSVIYIFLEILPFLLTVFLFAAIYMILPNTRVNFSAAVFGAFISAIAFIGVEWIYLTFQFGVSKYNAIYGGFAALPLFLIWTQMNWLIVLLGCELSFGFQNQSKYEFEIESKDISHSFRFILSLVVVKGLVRQFERGELAPTANELSEGLQIPAKLIRKILSELVKAKVISVVISEERAEERYQPSIDLAHLDVNFVRTRLNDTGINELPIEKNEEYLKIERVVNEMQLAVNSSKSNVLLKDV